MNLIRRAEANQLNFRGNIVKIYHFSDVKTQEQLLRKQLIGYEYTVLNKALKSMYKRVARFYGLNNKYNGDGTKRSA